MAMDVYDKLVKHLDNLPPGYPRTDSGVEMRILHRLFTPEDAELALHLTLIPEEARVIAIGNELSAAGGIRLVRMVYYQYAERLPRVSPEAYNKGWCRNLQRWWAGLAGWGG